MLKGNISCSNCSENTAFGEGIHCACEIRQGYNGTLILPADEFYFCSEKCFLSFFATMFANPANISVKSPEISRPVVETYIPDTLAPEHPEIWETEGGNLEQEEVEEEQVEVIIPPERLKQLSGKKTLKSPEVAKKPITKTRKSPNVGLTSEVEFGDLFQKSPRLFPDSPPNDGSKFPKTEDIPTEVIQEIAKLRPKQ